MAFAVFRSSTFYIDPYSISASLTGFYISLFALLLTYSCNAPVFLTFLIPTTHAMFIRPAFFTFTRFYATVWRFFSAVLIAMVTTKDAKLSTLAKPILWTFPIINTIESNPNALVILTTLSRSAVRI
jgi:hypothetical protein